MTKEFEKVIEGLLVMNILVCSIPKKVIMEKC